VTVWGDDYSVGAFEKSLHFNYSDNIRFWHFFVEKTRRPKAQQHAAPANPLSTSAHTETRLSPIDHCHLSETLKTKGKAIESYDIYVKSLEKPYIRLIPLS